MALNSKALALAAKVNKAMKGEALFVASEMCVPHRFPSGSISLDAALGGGWITNRWAEVVGLESHGKTAIILKSIAANQARNPDFTTLWVAGEHYDTEQAEALGVNNSQVILLPSQDLELVYDTVLEYIGDRAGDMVVIDSYPALISPDEGSKTVADDATIAEGARLTGKFFRKMGAAGLRNSRDPDDAPWVGLFVNQWRDVIGWQPTGSPGTTPGGKAKNYAFYQRLEVKRTEYIKEGDPVGQVIKVKPFKNKGGPPRREAVIDFYFADAPKAGFVRGEYDVAKESAIVGVLYGVITKGGSWFRFRNEQWQGLPNVIDSLREQPDLMQALYNDVMVAIHEPTAEPVVDLEDVEQPKSRVARKKS